MSISNDLFTMFVQSVGNRFSSMMMMYCPLQSVRNPWRWQEFVGISLAGADSLGYISFDSSICYMVRSTMVGQVMCTNILTTYVVMH